MTGRPYIVRWAFVVMASCILASCDQVAFDTPELPVIEAYVVAGKPLPVVSVQALQSLTRPRATQGAGLENAHVVMHLNNVAFEYASLGDGSYGPLDPSGPIVEPGDRFHLRVTWQDRTILASGSVPPSLSISDITVTPATDAIPAILVDTLAIGLDSLDLGLDAARGYVFPVQVDVAWNALADGWWMEAQLVPDDAFSSSILDFFLLPNAVFPEDPAVIRTWKGVYAVPVPAEDSPFPAHELLVAMVRGDQAFAAWAEARANTTTRAPTGNLVGAIGYVGGIAMDSIRIQLPQP